MSAIDDLIAQIEDRALRERLKIETARIAKEKKFGLVFEEHLPELTPLYNAEIRVGARVAKRGGDLSELWRVLSISEGQAVCMNYRSGEKSEFPIDEIMTVANFGEPVFPTLVPVDRVQNGPDDAPWHTLIEADNYHALQLLEYLYTGQVDCIYICLLYTSDTIWVDSGTFAGDLKVDKEGLALESLAGADATTISGNITITAGGATIEGFTIDGKVEGSEGFDPQAIFEDNVFPEGSRIIGNKIMVPAAETVYNLRTGDEYECIQSAVSKAELGDTILVGSGTYEEDLVIAVENLTLVSVEKHAAIIETQGDFEPGLGYGGITILADGVTIDGFKIKQSVAQAIVHTHNADGVTIKNNSISGIEPSRGIDIGYASAGSNSVDVYKRQGSC